MRQAPTLPELIDQYCPKKPRAPRKKRLTPEERLTMLFEILDEFDIKLERPVALRLFHDWAELFNDTTMMEYLAEQQEREAAGKTTRLRRVTL
jgi:hypothetical protein